jgi:polar amino acid transport system substrate-binding protein
MTRAALALPLVALTLAAAPGAWPQGGGDASLRAMLPERIREAGVITVATDPHAPPYTFYAEDNSTLVGLELDLVAEMEKKLGVRFEFSPMQFASVITSVQGGRNDMGISAFGDFVAREKIVDEIDYAYEATGIIVPKGNPHGVEKMADLCGLQVAVVQGTIPVELLHKQAGLCPSSKPLKMRQFPSNDQVVLAVRSGRADALLDTYGVAAYTLANLQGGRGGRDLELVRGPKYAVGLQAMIVSKRNTALRDAIQATLQAMVEDGSYRAAFVKWGLEENVLETITINDAARFSDYLNVN